MNSSRHTVLDRAQDSKGGGNYATLNDLMDKKSIKSLPFTNGGITVNGQFVLVSSSNVTGNVGVGTSTTETDGGLVTAKLSTAVGTASTTNVVDGSGSLANLCEIRDASSNDPILSSTGRKIFGLLQSDTSVTDGDAVGAPSSENIQISFAFVDGSNVLQLVSVTGSIEVSYPRLYALRHEPKVLREGSPIDIDVISAGSEPLVRLFVVTAAYAANEVINITTGAGSISGTSTVTLDTISSIGADAAAFNGENRTRIRLNGDQLGRGREVIYDSSVSLHFTFPIDVGDEFEIEIVAA